MTNFILWLILGTIIGWLASLILHPDGRLGTWVDIAIGAVGAFITGFVFTPLLGVSPIPQDNFSSPALLGALLGAILLLGGVNFIRRRGNRGHENV
jgi:uncharacterized membrane protein YeaQ/YmgE (transglycosylase-associated protein family)